VLSFKHRLLYLGDKKPWNILGWRLAGTRPGNYIQRCKWLAQAFNKVSVLHACSIFSNYTCNMIFIVVPYISIISKFL
jgi:hypothetical protein